MIQENASNDVIILSIDEARARGLAPRTVAGLPDLSLHVGDGSRRMRYIDWLMTEREHIIQSEECQADIVDEGNGCMALWAG